MPYLSKELVSNIVNDYIALSLTPIDKDSLSNAIAIGFNNTNYQYFLKTIE